jgi:hypothetical protein
LPNAKSVTFVKPLANTDDAPSGVSRDTCEERQ